jgi:hypothetical protein
MKDDSRRRKGASDSSQNEQCGQNTEVGKSLSYLENSKYPVSKGSLYYR